MKHEANTIDGSSGTMHTGQRHAWENVRRIVADLVSEIIPDSDAREQRREQQIATGEAAAMRLFTVGAYATAHALETPGNAFPIQLETTPAEQSQNPQQQNQSTTDSEQ